MLYSCRCFRYLKSDWTEISLRDNVDTSSYGQIMMLRTLILQNHVKYGFYPGIRSHYGCEAKHKWSYWITTKDSICMPDDTYKKQPDRV